MALIICPECGKQISDKSVACPHCGLPSEHYSPRGAVDNSNELLSDDKDELNGFDAKEFKNALVSFDRDHRTLLSPQYYIAASDRAKFEEFYER